MIKMSDLLNHIQITSQLNYYIERLHNKFMGQLRYSLGKLNGITIIDINRLFKSANINPDWFMDIYKQYPEGANTPRQPISNLLTLIILKCNLIGEKQLALDTNTLMGLIAMGRLMRKWFPRGVDQNIFDKTVDTLTKKGNIGMHGVIWTVNKITTDLYNRWVPEMLKDVDAMYPRYRYIIDMRNRFNQTIKTVATHYFYTWAHRNDVDLNVKVNERTKEIMEWINQNPIPMNILQYAATIGNCTTDKLNTLHHNIQLYNSMQSQMFVIVSKILEMLYRYMDQFKELNGRNIDINDPEFIKRFINNYKRSPIVLRMISDEVFKTAGYERFEVLAYAYILTIYVDSTNHYNDYNVNINNNNDNVNDTSEYEYDSDDDYSDYNESIEALYDGVILNEDDFLGRDR